MVPKTLIPLVLSLALGQVLVSAEVATSQPEAPLRLVCLNGKSLPLAALQPQGNDFVVATTVPDFAQGQVLSAAVISHIEGERPKALNQAIALLLSRRAKEARQLLEPIYLSQLSVGKIPGNDWVEATRMLLLCHATMGDAKKCSELGKQIADATPQQGIDPFANLSKALLMPASSSTAEDRIAAFQMVLTDDQPSSVRAFASYFLAEFFLNEKKSADALKCFYAVTNLYPFTNQIVCAAAQLKAAELIAAQNQRAEALVLVESAQLSATDTIIAEEAAKRLLSLK